MKNDAPKAELQSSPLEQARAEILFEAKNLYAERRAFLKRQFETNHDAEKLLRETTKLMDGLLKRLYDAAMAAAGEGSKGDPIAVIAVGGYGRDELFPYSDIDLLFLHDGMASAQGKAVVEFMMYVLWDLGLKVGHAQRSLNETLELAAADIGTRTTLLDARLICGSRKLFEQLQKRYREETEGTQMEFVEAKLAERDARHMRWGDSRYVLEPNIKEGKGGLRDLHTLYWIAKYSYGIQQLQDLVGLHVLTQEEYTAFCRARELMWRIRAQMHFTAGRTEDRMTFDMQRAVASELGMSGKDEMQSVQRIMKRYFMATATVGSLTRIFCALLESGKKRKPRIPLAQLLHHRWKLDGFAMEGERLSVADDRVFEKDPLQLIKLFNVAQEQGLDIHPHALKLVTRSLGKITREFQSDPRATEAFMRILLSDKSPETALRRMNEAGVLGRFIPDFGRVQGQMQFNMYHTYTVDEHTLFALGILHAIESGKLKDDVPLASNVAPRIQLKRALYLAMFCHDIAKGRGGDHSELGEKVTLKLATRFGLSQPEREMAAWLVKYHLLMSNTAFKRDINDPKTVKDFVGIVQSVERLRLLLVLTVADIRAVGPHVWNSWKAALLRDLYRRAEALMTTGSSEMLSAPVAATVPEIMPHLPGWTQEQVEEALSLGGAALWSSFGPITHARILRALRAVQGQSESPQLGIDAQHDASHVMTEVIVCTPDQHGLFSKMAGALALAGANIVGAKIFTLKNGMAVDVFQIQDSEKHAFDHPEKLERFETALKGALTGKVDLVAQLAAKQKSYNSRKDTFRVPAQVFIDNTASSSYTVIEVVGHDRVGFLYRVTKALADQGLSIVTAHINTYGKQVADVFYVKDVFGMKVQHDNKLQQIRQALLDAASN